MEETTEGESAEGQGDMSVLRTLKFNTQVEKKPARERKMEREGRETRKVWCHGGQGQRVLWRSECQATDNMTKKYQLSLDGNWKKMCSLDFANGTYC